MPPRTISEPLIQALAQVLGLSRGQSIGAIGEELSDGVARLSHLFTRGRGDLEASYLNEAGLRRAYGVYFLPVNLAKVQGLLDEMPASTFDPQAPEEPIRVLDLGSGPGTGALAVLDWLKRDPSLATRKLELYCLDRSAQALTETNLLCEAYGRLARVEGFRLVTAETDLERGLGRALATGLGRPEPQPVFSVILLANCLNELFRGHRQPLKKQVELIQGCASWLAPNGTIMILEPALRETARDLHVLRNELLGQPDRTLQVYSPCLHDEPCPALVKETDWCHEERPWTPPAFVAAIDRRVGFIKDALKFSYLLLRKDGERLAPNEADVYRVVSELRVMKGEKRAWLCNRTGRPEVGRLDRMQSQTNAAFDDWHRGAIVRIDQIVRKDRHGRESNHSTLGRIPAEATVEVIRKV